MHTGYVGVTTFQMLTHLYDNYGIITAVDIENNDEEMRTPYNPALPTESLFHQIEVVVVFSEAGNRPYEKYQVVSRPYLLILSTGLYQEACPDWDTNWTRIRLGNLSRFSSRHHIVTCG